MLRLHFVQTDGLYEFFYQQSFLHALGAGCILYIWLRPFKNIASITWGVDFLTLGKYAYNEAKAIICRGHSSTLSFHCSQFSLLFYSQWLKNLEVCVKSNSNRPVSTYFTLKLGVTFYVDQVVHSLLRAGII